MIILNIKIRYKILETPLQDNYQGYINKLILIYIALEKMINLEWLE